MSKVAFRAPGRVNLIGEHTDYNGGFVLPAAIDLYTTVVAESIEELKLVIYSANFNETHEFKIEDETPRGNWTDYPRGVYVMLRRAGVKLTGTKLTIQGEVPLGAGLSSSASIEVAVTSALIALSEPKWGGPPGPRRIPRSGYPEPKYLSSLELARLCQKAENEFTGARCGIMDQFIAFHGIAGHAIMLDCETMQHTPAPIPTGLSLVIANTMVKHALASGEYNQRRAECESAAKKLGLPSLRHATLSMLSTANLTPGELRRTRHNITENARVLQFVEAAQHNDLAALGQLMAASHASLRDDFEVSCPELDAMFDASQSLPGLIGARMTGGGFGGSTINLVVTENVTAFTETLAEAYQQRTGITPQIIVTSASAGVHAC